MKPLHALLAAGVAVASIAEPAEVYILDPAVSVADNIPEISREVARLLVQDRLAGEASLDVSDSVSLQDLTRSLGTYGKSESIAWMGVSRTRTPQLVVMIEGVTQANSKKLRATIKGTLPTFTVPEPPSSEANQDLVSNDYAEFNRPCSFDQAVKQDDECWKGANSLVVKYDALKGSSILDDVATSFGDLQAWASSGELETTLILVPESSRHSPIGGWGPRSQSTHMRRQAETVMEFTTATPEPESASLSNGGLVNSLPAPDATPLPYTFKTYKACMTKTSGCFGHGDCESPKGPNGDKSHFRCQCVTTKDENTGLETKWAGHSCERQDVSVEFWLFLGLFLIVVITIGGAMSAMYSLGSEPIPGVLGAGVVKSK